MLVNCVVNGTRHENIYEGSPPALLQLMNLNVQHGQDFICNTNILRTIANIFQMPKCEDLLSNL